MSADKAKGERLWCAIVFVFSGAVTALFTGSYITKLDMQQQAIDHGYAEYDQTTGEWQWKWNACDPPEKAERGNDDGSKLGPM